MKRLIILLSVAIALMPLSGIRAASLSPGDLIKASGPAVYYYHTDGTRLVFPNEKTYFTWYGDFSNVKTITDSELAAIPIGGNVTYRPGVRMVKVTTDPKVYAIGQNRTLRWVGSEALATELYGTNWATMIDDIPDAFFVDYNEGDAIASVGDYIPSALRDAAPTIADTRGTGPNIITQSMEKAVGELFTITLDSNATTGYTWEATFDDAYLELISSTYIAPETNLAGAGGQQEFIYKTLKQGTTQLTLNYRRSWEEGVEPVERRIYNLTIVPAEAAPEITITPNVSEAQANEIITILAETSYEGSINRIEILQGETLLSSCPGVKTCSATWTVPNVGTEPSYTFTARLTTMDDGASEATAQVAIVSEQMSDAILMTIERETVKPTQTAVIKVQAGAGLNSRTIEIYIDGQAKKICTQTTLTCRYEDYIHADIGTTHEVYARIETPARLWYRSNTKIITIAENDSPSITVTVGQAEILPTATIDITVAASDDDGISYTELIRDGAVLKHCIGAAPCTVDVGPFDLPSGSVVMFDAKAEDLTGIVRTLEDAAFITIK